MTAPWVMLFKYSNDPEYLQSIISDYSARGRGNKLIKLSQHNRKHVQHTQHTRKRGLEGSRSVVQMSWVGCADSPVNMALKQSEEEAIMARCTGNASSPSPATSVTSHNKPSILSWSNPQWKWRKMHETTPRIGVLKYKSTTDITRPPPPNIPELFYFSLIIVNLQKKLKQQKTHRGNTKNSLSVTGFILSQI